MRKAFMYELNTSVGFVIKFVEDISIKNEDGLNIRIFFKGIIQGCIIFQA